CGQDHQHVASHLQKKLKMAEIVIDSSPRFVRYDSSTVGGPMRRSAKFFALISILMLSGVASAATLVVNCGTVSGPTELTAAAILCPQFNLLGQVISNIQIAVSGGITGSITLTNGDNVPQTGSGTTTTGFSFGALTGFTFVNPI